MGNEIRIRARLADLREQAELKPAGFLDACREAAEREEKGVLVFVPEVYGALFERFRGCRPTPGQKTRHALLAAWRWARGGFRRVDEATRERRAAICRECAFWQRDPAFGFMACSQCGCSRLKWELREERCPEGKW